MKFSKEMLVILPLSGLVITSAAVVSPDRHEFKNLRVLPKDINSKELSRIMVDEFEDGLGVSCNFCHAEQDGSRLDYSSDAKPEKQVARLMIRMTMNINRKFFKAKNATIGDSILVVKCVTCHNGQALPLK